MSSTETSRRTLLSFALLAATSAGASAQQPHFTDIAGDSGLRFKHTFGAEKLESILMTTGSGCALFDYDNDGWLDAFLVNGTRLDKEGNRVREHVSHHALFHNRGDGTFANVTRASGITEPTYGQGVACADYDGDGFVDLYVTNYGPNRMYHNRGDGTFEDVTEKAGTPGPPWSTGATFFDYDGDGDLDLFVAGYVRFDPGKGNAHASSLSKRAIYRVFPGPRDYEPEPDALYRNDGDGTFTDVSGEVGLVQGGKGLTVTACDFDGDGDDDLFVANDSTANFLYRNDGSHFVEVALDAGVAFDPDGVETAGMGVDVTDLDENGFPDLFVTNMVFEFNNLYMNYGHMTFLDRTKEHKLSEDNYRHVGWGTCFVDFNHDGALDCFVANGHVVDYVEGLSQSITYGQRNMLFVGDAKGRFTDRAEAAGPSFKQMRVSRGAAFGDIDNDGDVDILLLNSGGRAELLRNDLGENDRWLEVRLRGRAPNTDAIGAKVTLVQGERRRTREVRWGASYLSSSEPTLHFGLGDGPEPLEIEVRWPSGESSKQACERGTKVTVTEPE